MRNIILIMLALGLMAASADANVLDVAVGNEHTCAISSIGGTSGGGKVYCWGGNGYGQLGLGDTSDKLTATNPTTANTDFIQVGAGAYHTCALRAGGQVLCWGYGFFGVLGNNSTNGINPTPVTVVTDAAGNPPLATVHSIAVGAYHTCASLGTPGSTATVRCWGYNGQGEIGNNTQTEAHIAVVAINPAWNSGVTSTMPAIVLSAGYEHTCAIVAPFTPYHNANRTYCWGWNDKGQVGNNSNNPNLLVPTEVNQPINVTFNAVSCGNHRSYATSQTNLNGHYRWGTPMPYNETGSPNCQSGGGKCQITPFLATIAYNGLTYFANFMTTSKFTDMSNMVPLGGSYFMNWNGSNGSGQVGDGTYNACPDGSHCASYIPLDIFGNTYNPGGGVIEPLLGTGAFHTCLANSYDLGTVYCWGLGNNGRLGNNSGQPSAVPYPVRGPGGNSFTF